jgi:hypothetical protein
MQVGSKPIPENYAAVILRAYVEGRISEDAYAYYKRHESLWADPRPLPEIPSTGIWVSSLGPGAL